MRLALDTSGSVSAAVVDGATVLAARQEYAPRSHAELLVPMARAVLAEAGAGPADLRGLVAGTGPGPFTGLRVALVSAATMALALDVPARGVCSLSGLALAVGRELTLADGTEFVVATDARRREVYHARYRWAGGHAHQLTAPQVGPATEVDLTGAAGCAGRGVQLYPDALPALPGAADLLDPVAADLALTSRAELLRGDATQPLEPLYLRRPDATPPA